MLTSQDRPTVAMRPLARRQRPGNTTAVVPALELPRSPPPTTGMRKAQLMDLYVRLLEEAHRLSLTGGSCFPRFYRINLLLERVRTRLAR